MYKGETNALRVLQESIARAYLKRGRVVVSTVFFTFHWKEVECLVRDYYHCDTGMW